MCAQTQQEETAGSKWLELEAVGIARLLHNIARQRFSGPLYLSRGQDRHSLIFYLGRPVYSQSNTAKLELGQMLLAKSLITPAQIEEARAEEQKSSKPLGTVLAQLGMIPGSTLVDCVKQQIKAIVNEIFRWPDGQYFLEPQNLGERETLELEETLVELILEGIRKTFDFSRLAKEGLKPQLRVTATTPVLTLPEDPHLLRLRGLIDGQKTIQNLVDESGLEASDVLRDLFFLKVMAAADFVDSAESTKSPAPDLEAALASLPSQPAPAASGTGPVILGDVEGLEAAYQAKKKTQTNDPGESDIVIGDEEGEITLEPHAVMKAFKKAPPPAAAPETSDSAPSYDEGETTLDNMDGLLDNETKPADEPVAPKVEPVESVEVSEPERAVSENKTVPRSESKPAKDFSEESAEGFEDENLHPSSSFWPRFARFAAGFLLAAVLIVGTLAFLIYQNPMRAMKWVEGFRLQKMYGRADLDSRRLGRFYADDGRLKAAKAALQDAVRENPADVRVLMELAQVHRRLDEWPLARETFAEVIQKNPTLSEAHLGLAWCFLQEAEVLRAKEHFYLYLAYAADSPQKETIRQLVQSFQ